MPSLFSKKFLVSILNGPIWPAWNGCHFNSKNVRIFSTTYVQCGNDRMFLIGSLKQRRPVFFAVKRAIDNGNQRQPFVGNCGAVSNHDKCYGCQEKPATTDGYRKSLQEIRNGSLHWIQVKSCERLALKVSKASLLINTNPIIFSHD